jgi:hypothetical protein
MCSANRIGPPERRTSRTASSLAVPADEPDQRITCSAVDHAREMVDDGASIELMHALAAWSDAPHIIKQDKVALHFAEQITRLAYHHDPICDAQGTPLRMVSSH